MTLWTQFTVSTVCNFTHFAICDVLSRNWFFLWFTHFCKGKYYLKNVSLEKNYHRFYLSLSTLWSLRTFVQPAYFLTQRMSKGLHWTKFSQKIKTKQNTHTLCDENSKNFISNTKCSISKNKYTIPNAFYTKFTNKNTDYAKIKVQ